MQSKLLAIYLNDHLAGATVGVAVAQRVASSNRRSNTYYSAFSGLAEEIREDRASLLGIMRALNVRTDPVKQLLAWSAEKAGRLKLNGHLLAELIARAERQFEEIEACRRRAVVDAFLQ
jgi:hypothetical protein